MFGSPYTFHGLLTREPASITCDDKQGDLFCVLDLHGQLLATPNTVKKWREDFFFFLGGGELNELPFFKN